MVEDMQLTGDLQAMRYATKVSPSARAYAGPMVTVRSLWHQRRKWDEGMIRLLVSSMVTSGRPRVAPAAQPSARATRAAFLFMLSASLTCKTCEAGGGRCGPRRAGREARARLAGAQPFPGRPDRRALLVPVEIYLVMRVACAPPRGSTCWPVSNGTAGQIRPGQAGRLQRPGQGARGRAAGGRARAGWCWAWTHAPLFVQQRTLTVGWGALAVITALQTLIMVIRIFRRPAACVPDPKLPVALILRRGGWKEQRLPGQSGSAAPLYVINDISDMYYKNLRIIAANEYEPKLSEVNIAR